MTIEEASKVLKECRDFESYPHIIEALDIAIKVLEQINVPDTNVGKLDGDLIDIDKAVEHYEGTLEMLKGIDFEDDEDIPMEYFESGGI